MNKNIIEEKRRDERFSFTAPQKLQTTSGKKLYLIGLSQNGAHIACTEKPHYNDIIHFDISLPTGIHTLSLSGKIIWAIKKDVWHVGLHFIPMTEIDTTILIAYLEYLERDKKLKQFHKTIHMNLERYIQTFLKQ
ncbi:MAG: PilZ domain-containing protein [bacterium]